MPTAIDQAYALFQFGDRGVVNLHMVYPVDHQSISVTIGEEEFPSAAAVYDDQDSQGNNLGTLERVMEQTWDEALTEYVPDAENRAAARAHLFHALAAFREAGRFGLPLTLGLVGTSNDGDQFGLPDIVLLGTR